MMKTIVLLFAVAFALVGANANCLCLYGPDNIAFDDSGNIYLVDTDHKRHSRVLKLSPAGAVLGDWRVFATGPKENGPEGIAIDRAGKIYVTDAGSGHVLKLSSEGTLLGALGSPPVNFPDLGHVTIDPAGSVFVAQALPNSIQKFSPDGVLVAAWHLDRSTAGIGRFSGPQTIAARADGSIVVEHWPMRRIDVLSSDGRLLLHFGSKGQGRNQFVETAGLAVDRTGNIFVADIGIHRVQKFDAQGRWLTSIGNSAQSTIFNEGPGSVAVDRAGNLYSADGLSVVKYSQAGSLIARWQ